ncbi:MAG: hypothetical protein ACR2QT_12210 [Woeseiaceae bacterium]
MAILIGMLLQVAWTAASGAHQYTISVDDNLQKMTVEARFDRPIDYISARSRYAPRYLGGALDCDTNKRLTTRGRRLEIPAAGLRCLSYDVSLASADRDAEKIVISPTLWMWRPRLRRDDEILTTFELPDDAGVFVPWQMIDDDRRRYRLVASPESGTATAVFGQFEEHIETIADTRIRIVLLGPQSDITLEKFVPWINSTAQNIEQTYGRFPNPNVGVILNPVSRWGWGGDRAVSFGRVVRDGGETIELMINPDRPITDYYDEWTPTHEFSHLMLPYVDREQRWISEGFAQYYQNVLLARAGQHSALDAWQKIYTGLERGRESAPGISPNDAANGRMRDTRMKVYWSGASLALMADVELRRRSDGRQSLDSVLGDLQQCCLPSARSWSGVEFFAKLDELLGDTLFMDLYRKYADADDFPDPRPLLARLGVSARDGAVALDDGAELSVIRETITRQDTRPH